MPCNHLIFCRLLLLLPSVFLGIRVFSSELAVHIRWPKYWSFSISPSNEGWTGWISLKSKELSRVFFNTAVQKHQFFSSASFMVQLSHLYVTTRKTIALIIWTIVSKVMSLLFNTLSKIFIVFLRRSKHLLISWLQSPSAVILEPKKIKSVTVFVVAKNELDICRCPSLLDT